MSIIHYMSTHSRNQELANNSEIEKWQNKSHTKITELTVVFEGIMSPQPKVVFFLFSFTSLSSFFTHIETNQSVGGAKTGVPGEKPPDTPASRTYLVPHVTCAPSEARTHSGEMIE